MSLKTTLRASAAAAALFAMSPSVADAATLTGRVSDSTGAASLSGARVELLEINRRTSTGQGGVYRFTEVDSGRYTLRVTYINADVYEQAITVSGDGIITADVALQTEVEEIIVVGQVANISSALSRQNVAESVRRITGVNVLNDQGEGRFIAVRGLDPNLNSSTINGARVPAPESDIRAVALDVIPSELIESIEITKTLTPDMDADTIGASIDINTTSAFDRDGLFLGATLEGSYNDLRDTLTPKGSVDFSTAVNEKFGVAGGLSFYNRKFSTDNIEPEGWDTTDGGITYPDEIQYRDYDVQRKRLGASLSLDFRPSETTELYTRGLYSRFADQEFRNRVIFKFDEEPSSGSSTSATFLSDDGEIEVERDIKDRLEVQKIYSLAAGGETFKDEWTFEYGASWSRAEEQEDDNPDPAVFVAGFEDPGALGVSLDYSNFKIPTFSINPGLAAFNDPGSYEFDELEFTDTSDATDEEFVLKGDITHQFVLDNGGTFDIKFGGKARLRQKDYNFDVLFFEDGPLEAATLVGLTRPASYGLQDLGLVPDPFAIRDIAIGNLSAFDVNDIDSAFDSAVSDYSVDEDVYAGYLMGRYDNGSLKAIAGVRVEHTKDDMTGNFVELVEEGGTRDGVVLDDDTVFVSPIAFSNNYTDWLPSVNITYETQDDVLFRFGAFRSLVRPNLAQLAPRFVVEEADNGEREGEFGNPDLKPYEAWNVDASIEWYFNNSGVLQGGVFYKDIKDFIVISEVENTTFNGVFIDEADIPINGDTAEVIGFEFGYQQVMDFLPGPWDGVLAGVNYTYTDAEGRLADGRKISLPASSEHTFNANLGYEKGPIR
jgi:TonB-dependent receptor